MQKWKKHEIGRLEGKEQAKVNMETKCNLKVEKDGAGNAEGAMERTHYLKAERDEHKNQS